MEQSFPQDDRFFFTYDESFIFPLSDSCSLPYPKVLAWVHFPPLRPNSTFVLYCPLTGCPQQPEVLVELMTDDDGKMIKSTFVEENKDICGNFDFMISLYANPGYCSDWYLISLKPFSVICTSFTYKPITIDDDEGRRLTICKKEPGGNVLEIVLKKFLPKQQLIVTSLSSGETISHPVETDNDGSYVFQLLPQVIGYTKGIDLVTVCFDGKRLQTSCEWEVSTLDIQRLQPISYLWKIWRSSSPYEHPKQTSSKAKSKSLIRSG
jgi:hypothetical protein